MFRESVAHTKTNLYDLFYATKAKRTYTNLGVSLLLVIVFLIFALVPTLSTLDSIRDSINDYKAINASLKTKIDAVRNLAIQENSTSDNGGVKDELQFLNKVFLKDYNLTPIYVNMYERAKVANVKITSLTPRYPIGSTVISDSVLLPPSTNSYEVSVTAESNQLSELLNFTKSLESAENMPLPTRIKNLSLRDLSQQTNSQGDIIGNTTGFSTDFVIIVYIDPSVAIAVQ